MHHQSTKDHRQLQQGHPAHLYPEDQQQTTTQFGGHGKPGKGRRDPQRGKVTNGTRRGKDQHLEQTVGHKHHAQREAQQQSGISSGIHSDLLV